MLKYSNNDIQRDETILQIFNNIVKVRRFVERNSYKLHGKSPLSPLKADILNYILVNKRTFLKDIVTEFQISNSAVAQIIDALFQNKYIDYRHDIIDKRVVVVSITKKGKNALDRYASEKTSLILPAFDDFNLDELHYIKGLYDRVINNIVEVDNEK
jgi:DNA-binding MarR family transcriptional regulator